MKVILSIIIMLVTSTFLLAQNYFWAAQGYSGDDQSHEVSTGVAVDSKGYTYVGGYFYGTVSFSGVQLVSQGNGDIYISKYSPTGELTRVIQIGSTGYDRIHSLAIDENNKLYVTGSFQHTVDFGSIVLNSTGGSMFLGKFDTDLNTEWVIDGNNAFTAGLDLALDQLGNIYITGQYNNEITIGDRTLPDSGSGEPFFAKFDNNGNAVWANYANSLGCCVGIRLGGIDVDDSGNVYVAGSYLTETQVGTTVLAHPNDFDTFLAKLDQTGAYEWVKSANSTKSGEGDIIASDLMIDQNNNLVLVGSFKGTAPFGDELLVNTSHAYNGFIVRYNPTGEVTSAQKLVSHDLRIHKIAHDEQNNYYLIGQFRNFAQFGNIDLQITSLEGFVAKLSSQQTFDIAFATNSEYAATGLILAVNKVDDLTITGSFQGGDLNVGCDTLNTHGLASYITRVDLKQTLGDMNNILTVAGPEIVCPNNQVTYKIDDAPTSVFFEWDLPDGFTPISGTNVTNADSIQISIEPWSNGGEINVSAQKCNDFWESSSLEVVVNLSLETPEIIVGRCELTLQSSILGQNQWYFNGATIPNADQSELRPKEAGSYSVSIKNECYEVFSEPVDVNPVRMDNFVITNLYLPSDSTFFVMKNLQGASFELFNTTGALVYKTEDYQRDLELVTLTDGLYLYRLQVDCLEEVIKGKVLIFN